MEEIEIRDAIRRHVTSGEPPLGLSAQALLGEGRLRQRRRLGLGSGAAAAAALLVGSLTLNPLWGAGPAGGDGCRLPLARHWTPRPSGAPLFVPPTATVPGGSLGPTYGGPTVSPTETAVAPTDGPSVPPTDGPGESFQPTDGPTVPPTDGPGPSFQPTGSPIWPTDGPLPSVAATYHPTPDNVLTAQCRLMKWLQEAAPGAGFAGGGAPRPFEFYGDLGHYASNGAIVGNDGTTEMVFILINPLDGPPETDGWTRETVAGRDVFTLPNGDGFQLAVFHAHTKILWITTGHMISEQQVAALLTSPEFDIAA
jgi:hypothetical protein